MGKEGVQCKDMKWLIMKTVNISADANRNEVVLVRMRDDKAFPLKNPNQSLERPRFLVSLLLVK